MSENWGAPLSAQVATPPPSSLSIGDSVTGATAGSMLFVGAGSLLSQDNSNLSWDPVNAALSLRTPSGPGSPLYVRADIGGASAMGAVDADGIEVRSYWGYYNSAYPLLYMRGNHGVVMEDAQDFMLSNDASKRHHFGMTTGASFYQLGDGAAGTPGLSDSGYAKIRYNDTTKKLQVSLDGAAYADLSTGGGGGATIGGSVGGGAAGAVLFIGTGGVLAQDTANLFWDYSSLTFGIGTSTPVYPLDIRSSSGAAKLHLSGPTAADDGLYALSAQASQAWISGGASYNGTSFVAKATEASTLDMVGGGYLFYSATGLTPGGSYPATTKFHIYPEGGIEVLNSDSATVSLANAGKIRYNTSGQKFQVSSNGGAYIDLSTGTGMSIGGSITSGTAGRVLFEGAGPVLADSSLFTYAVSGGTGLTVKVNAPSDAVAYITNTDTGDAGRSSLQWKDRSSVVKGEIGYGGTATSIAHWQGNNILYSTGPDWVLTNTTRNEFAFGMTPGSSFFHIQGADAPQHSQYKMSVAAGGALSMLSYSTDNQHIGFDIDFESGGFIARNATVAGIYKYLGVLRFQGGGGNTNGSSPAQNVDIMAIDLATQRVGIGTTSGMGNALTVYDATVGGLPIVVRATNANSYSGVSFFNSSNTEKGSVGHGNASAGLTHVQNKNFLYSTGPDYVIVDATAARFAFDMTNFRFGIGTAAPVWALHVKSTQSASALMRFEQTSSDAYCGAEYFDSSNTFKAGFGYANSTVGITHLQGNGYWYSAGPDFVLANATKNEIRFDMTDGSVAMEMAAGDSAGGRAGYLVMRYNTTLQKLEINPNNAGWQTVTSV